MREVGRTSKLVLFGKGVLMAVTLRYMGQAPYPGASFLVNAIRFQKIAKSLSIREKRLGEWSAAGAWGVGALAGVAGLGLDLGFDSGVGLLGNGTG